MVIHEFIKYSVFLDDLSNHFTFQIYSCNSCQSKFIALPFLKIPKSYFKYVNFLTCFNSWKYCSGNKIIGLHSNAMGSLWFSRELGLLSVWSFFTCYACVYVGFLLVLISFNQQLSYLPMLLNKEQFGS